MNTNNETEGKMHSKTTEQRGEVSKRFRFKIWQIESCEENIPYLFTDSEFLIQHEGTVFPPPKDIYREVYSSGQNHFDTEDVFKKFNTNLLSNYHARSLSMSDNLEYELPNDKKLYLYCDRYWFIAVDFRSKYQIAKLPEYSPGSKTDKEHVTLFYKGDDGMRSVSVTSENLFSASYIGTTQDGNTVQLKPAEIYNATLFILNGRSHYRNDNIPKTLNSWLNCGIHNFFDFIYPGDAVDKELIDHYVNGMDGTVETENYLQAGKAISVMYDDKSSVWPAYVTFTKKDDGWYYVGICRQGDSQNIAPFFSFPKRIEKMMF